MITEKDIAQAREQEKLSAQSFLEGVVDFVKYTSTVSIAGLLWVGNSIGVARAPFRSILAVSLLFLVCSLIVAVITIWNVLVARGKEWDADIEDEVFVLLKKLKAIEPSKVSEQKESEQIHSLIKTIEASKPFARPTVFNRWVIVHVIFLVLGVTAYALAQFLTSL
jgi:hypothetical protein